MTSDATSEAVPAAPPPERLAREEFRALIERVFRPTADDRRLAILVDLPDAVVGDRPRWAERRALAQEWATTLGEMRDELGIETALYLYGNVHSNNADLPAAAWRHRGGTLPARVEELDPANTEPLAEVFARHHLLLAPTEFSTTAPLKLAARRYRFRAATMPGFSSAMIPALRLDYGEIDRRVRLLKELLDAASGADFDFVSTVDPGADAPPIVDSLHLDLRHRQAHASSGLLTEPGTAGNLPSGESYVVPYEGERPGDPSRSAGVLPVQLGDEVVRYRIVENRAVSVEGEGPAADRERDHLAREPAYGNVAELGLGVLTDFGLQPIGEILLDEKLGPHVAFGRSDHFGGQVGAADFSSPAEVVHIDRVYLPETQPRVLLRRLELRFPDGASRILVRDGRFTLWAG